MSLPAYSVIVRAGSERESLGIMLQNLEAQVHAPERVVIIADKSSADLGYSDLRGRKFPVQWMAEPHLSPPQFLNLAIDAIPSRWMAILNDHDVVLPERFARQVLQCEGERADLGASEAIFIDERGETIPDSHPSIRFFRDVPVVPDLFAHLFLDNRVVPSTALFRTDAVRRIGKVDERFAFLYDFDLSLKLARPRKYCFLPATLTRCRPLPGLSESARERNLEMGLILGELENSHSSLLYQLMEVDYEKTLSTFWTHPMYPMRFLAEMISARQGFTNRQGPFFQISLDERETKLLNAMRLTPFPFKDHLLFGMNAFEKSAFWRGWRRLLPVSTAL